MTFDAGQRLSAIDIAGAALLWKPERPLEHDRSGIAAVRYEMSAALSAVIEPLISDADEYQKVPLRGELHGVEDTINFGINDIEDVFWLADRALRNRRIQRVRHAPIMLRSSRLIVGLAGLDNYGVQDVLERAREEKQSIELREKGEHASLHWNDALKKWMDTSPAEGCPARTALVKLENGKKVTQMNLLWQRAAEAVYGPLVGN